MAMKVAKDNPKPSKQVTTPPPHLTKKALKAQLKQVGKSGRPSKDISSKMVIEMAADDYTVEEIAAHIPCAPSVLYDRFSEELNEGWKRGQASLKKKMHQKALDDKGDSNMLIWLSKQRCGYRDRPADEAVQTVFNINVSEIPK
jgi:hypothetical protein